MKALKNFIKWFTDLGGAMDQHMEDVCKARMQPVPVPKSSFRNRPEEIKEKFNHKFKAKPVEDDFLNDVVDIDFEKK